MAVAIATGTDSAEAGERAWQAARAMREIQYAPVPPAKIPPQADAPEWLKAIFRFLAKLLEPLGRLLGNNWSSIEFVLAALAIVGALWIAGLLAWRWWQARRPSAPAPDQPIMDRAAALALLEDADALAAQGRYGEAARLLLQRSVHHIASTRPDWLSPSSTAREIGAIPGLPGSAKQALGVIVREVERSLYALRALAAEDWRRTREAYTAFALADLAQRP